ncbi:hypothetical protein IFR05_007192 [Cadophora sp. M221]|nr:hypothetical protein IFR05_007192 [Cadophora sp. M221]
MGSTLSSLKSTIGARPREEVMASDDEEDEQHRPTKRRKLAESDETASAALDREDDDMIGHRRPFGQVTNESRRSSFRFSAKPDLIKPINFYGRPESAAWNPDQLARLGKPGKKSFNRCLPRTPVDFSEAMRIDLLRINAEYQESPPNAEWGHEADINCRCGVAIYYAKNDEKPGEVKPQDFREICRLVKSCKYRISISTNGEVSREIILPEPFIFTPDHFYVYRRTRKPNGQWDQHSDGFGFADKYNIKVFIEPMGTSGLWPGMILKSDSDGDVIASWRAEEPVADEDVSLYARTNPWLSAERHSKTDLYAIYKNRKEKIQYSLRMQIRWSLPSQLNDLTSKRPRQVSAPGFLPPRTPVTPGSPPKTEVPLPPDSPGDSRAARRRSNVPTYNLKALSSIAQGKSPRASQVQRSRSEQRDADNGEITVTYCFGKAEAAETGIKRETMITGLKCPFCLSRNRSLDELRLHLSTDHSAYRFHARRPNPPRITFFVELAKSSRPGSLAVAERSKIIQLGQPMTLFDLEKHLAGDESWTKARSGPLHNIWPGHLVERRMIDSSHSSSPRESRQSSPNTPNEIEDFMDVDKYEPEPATKRRKVHLVPKIDKPLYDTVTKRLLVADEVLANSDDETDESWLHQQRRDGIDDFTDIPSEEKEYINRFNPFIFEERLTSMKHLPEAIVRFVEDNKSWLAGKVSRRQEFSKHMENFVLKGYVDESVHDRCIRILIAEKEDMKQRNEMTENGGNEDVDMDRVEQPALPTRGLNSCVCGEVTIPPNRVVCRNMVSQSPSYFQTPQPAVEAEIVIVAD